MAAAPFLRIERALPLLGFPPVCNPRSGVSAVGSPRLPVLRQRSDQPFHLRTLSELGLHDAVGQLPDAGSGAVGTLAGQDGNGIMQSYSTSFEYSRNQLFPYSPIPRITLLLPTETPTEGRREKRNEDEE
jgi:hypothetical protein